MTRHTLLFLLFIVPYSIFGQGMNEGSIIYNTIQIKTGDITGSGFIIDLDSSLYLISAKHLFPGVTNKANVKFLVSMKGKWNSAEAVAHIHTDPLVDVIVLDLKKKENKPRTYGLTATGTSIAQNCFFIGFPLGIQLPAIDTSRGLPTPLVKHAIVSGMINENGRTLILLDGHNNKGFSGGPVIVNNPPGSSTPMNIIGIVSGFRKEDLEGDFAAQGNSGIMIVWSSDMVYQILKEQ